MTQRIAKLLIAARLGILLLLGVGTYFLISVYHISLWWILAAGAVSGIIFGKVFCRWVCPMGIMMELMMTFSSDKNAALLQYHKLGCPIAWVSGWLNRMSLFGIRRGPHLHLLRTLRQGLLHRPDRTYNVPRILDTGIVMIKV